MHIDINKYRHIRLCVYTLYKHINILKEKIVKMLTLKPPNIYIYI